MWAATAIAKRDIPLGENKIKKGTEITITKSVVDDYTLWSGFGIYTLPKEYVCKIKIISKQWKKNLKKEIK